MNKMKELAEIFGVTLDEPFRVYFGDGNERGDSPFTITERGFKDSYGCNGCSGVLYQILIGLQYIEKIPWKPKKGDTYYSIVLSISGNSYVSEFVFDGVTSDLLRYKCKNMFRTFEEAEENKERVVKELQDYYENN